MQAQMLGFKLQPSRRFLSLFSLFFLLTMGYLWATPISCSWKMVFFVIALFYGALVWQQGLLKRHAITYLKRTDESLWQIQIGGQLHEAFLQGDSVVTHLITVLRFQRKGRRRQDVCLILRDSLPNDGYRRLVVCLRAGLLY